MKDQKKDVATVAAPKAPTADPKKVAAEANVAKQAAKPSSSAAVFNSPAKASVKLPRPGTKRAQVIARLQVGATAEEIRAMFPGWGKRHVVECLRILHNSYGFGFKTDAATGKVTILGL